VKNDMLYICDILLAKIEFQTFKKLASMLLAMALARSVFPVPGGP
jgi:hypothetical protein